MKNKHTREPRSGTGIRPLVWATVIAAMLCSTIAAAESRHGALRYPKPLQRTASVQETLPQASRWETVLKAPAPKDMLRPETAGKLQPVRIGFPRFPPKMGSGMAISERPEWIQRADGGWPITLEVTSVDARAVRASIALQTFPSGTSLVFFGGTGEYLSTISPAQSSKREGNGRNTGKSVGPSY